MPGLDKAGIFIPFKSRLQMPGHWEPERNANLVFLYTLQTSEQVKGRKDSLTMPVHYGSEVPAQEVDKEELDKKLKRRNNNWKPTKKTAKFNLERWARKSKNFCCPKILRRATFVGEDFVGRNYCDQKVL